MFANGIIKIHIIEREQNSPFAKSTGKLIEVFMKGLAVLYLQSASD